MQNCNPFVIYYSIEALRHKKHQVKEVFDYPTTLMKQLTQRVEDARVMIKKRWSQNPNFLNWRHSDTEEASTEWQEICLLFTEALTDHLLFHRAIKVEAP